MSRLPRLTAKQAVLLIQKYGFVFMRQTGSHAIYRHKSGIRITIPIHVNKSLHPKIVKSMLDDIKKTND
ncbi:MAG TPA: type II toxin-antitoxin system HicA family toxin [Candidatus Paceibacterota bacterium]